MGASCTSIAPEDMNDLKEKTNFSGKEIKQWYRKYCEESHYDGPLTKDEFIDMYQKLFPKGDAAKFAEHTFHTYDHNKDGMIDFREFMITLNLTVKGSADEKLKWMFTVYDVNGDGHITKDEAAVIIKSIWEAKGVKDVPIDEKDAVNHIFDILDVDKDDRLSEEEFMEGAKKCPHLINSVVSNFN